MEKLITRTIITKEIEALTVNTETNEVKTMSIGVPSTCKDIETALKWYRKTYPEALIQIAKINFISEKETLYGCTESEFLSVAHELPPRKLSENLQKEE